MGALATTPIMPRERARSNPGSDCGRATHIAGVVGASRQLRVGPRGVVGGQLGGSRIKQKWHCPSCEVDIERSDTVKGYEFAKNQYVRFEEEELRGLQAEQFQTLDIVQFVPFKEFMNDPRQLARETLEEVPRQFVDFMERNGIKPAQVHEEEKNKIRSMLSRAKTG